MTPLSPAAIALSIAVIWEDVSPSVVPAETLSPTPLAAASFLAASSIHTKYGFENVFRTSATFTLFPPELDEAGAAVALELDAPEAAELLELALEPHAATVNAAAAASPARARRRPRPVSRRRGWAARRLRNIYCSPPGWARWGDALDNVVSNDNQFLVSLLRPRFRTFD